MPRGDRAEHGVVRSGFQNRPVWSFIDRSPTHPSTLFVCLRECPGSGAGGQHLVSLSVWYCFFLSCLFILRHGAELFNYSRLAHQETLGTHLSLPPRCWRYTPVPPCFDFYVGPGDPMQVFTLVQQDSDHRSISLSFVHSFLSVHVLRQQHWPWFTAHCLHYPTQSSL